MEVVLAVIGIVLVAAGVGMWSVPAGVLVAGAQCIAAAYVSAYVKARAGK